MAVISGTGGNDTRIGSAGYDTISTGNGNDLIFAVGGNDTAYGGNGQDTAYGGDGRDWLYGNNGRDSLFGDAAGDRLDGGNDNDVLNGGTGDDTVWGGNGADQLWGGDDNDSVFGGAGNDLVGGGSGDDVLAGGAGTDSLRGLDGTDTAVFSGAIAGYTITRNGGLIRVTDNDSSNGDDGTDRLGGVERLRFADRTVTLTPLDLDVAIGDVNAAGRILLNLGGEQGGAEGSFADKAVAIPGGTLTFPDLALGDLDGDGDLDGLVVSENQPVLILENEDGAGGLVATAVADSTTRAFAVALGDLDGDGDLDALVGTWTGASGGADGNNRLLLNQGGLQGGNEGDFALDTDPVAGGERLTNDLALGDLDGDGDLDVLVGNTARGGNQILWNQGGNTVDFVAEEGPGNARSTTAVALGDLDNDGDLDGIIGNANDYDQILLNQGGLQGGNEGDFTVTNILTSVYLTQGIAVGDLDGDGDLDAVATGERDVRAYVNQGGLQSGNLGDFVGAYITSVGGEVRGVALGDLDGDGDLDVVIGPSGAESRVLINQGGLQGGSAGTFADGPTLAGGSPRTSSIVVGDLDGDGSAGLTPAGLPIVGPGVPIVADPDWPG